MTTTSYIITAKRMTGETLFYCEGLNGATMTPNAQSLAVRHETREMAKPHKRRMAARYRGLSNWRVEKLGIE